MAKLYLFPTTMTEAGAPTDVLPVANLLLLNEVRYFIVENVRTARRFLKRCNQQIEIGQLQFFELNRHTDAADIPAMLQPLREGHDMGVISEAGCPAIADPGADVVAIAQREGLDVVPLVGPSSILMGLMGSGFNGQNFAFIGYLPIDPKARAAQLKEMLRRIRHERQTQIFIETPYRNNKLIAELCRLLPPDTLLCVASDITGPKQKITTLPVSRWAKAKYDYDRVPSIFLLYN